MKAGMIIAAVFLLVLMGAVFVVAAPSTPTNVVIDSSTRRSQSTNSVAVPAQAGNVTQLTILDNRTTSHWAGYYGTINGEITLDDGTNSTLYAWSMATPTGEVYASNSSTVSWSNITCVNLTSNTSDDVGAKSKLNNSLLENFWNITSTDNDGINETFTSFYTSSFDAGSTTINSASGCPLAYMFVNNASQSTNFQEVILTDNVSSVWTSLLENDATGFDGSSLDFEMIVPENSGAGTTDFYFFVELA